MKQTIILLISILIIQVACQTKPIEQTEEYSTETISPLPINYENAPVDLMSQQLEKNPKKIFKCIKEGIKEIKDLIKLIKDIKQKKIPGTLQDITRLIKRVGTLLDNCMALFCWGPTLKKCRRHHNPQGCEKFGLLVYPKCKKGFTNLGCCTCTNKCPEGFTDTGLHCLKPDEAYGRGAGFVLWKKDLCLKENPQGCEQSGALWYPKCKSGFHPVGCCICSPDCPSQWTDIGISCKKPKVYGRGQGYPVSFGIKCLFARKIVEREGQNNCEEQRGYLGMLGDGLDFMLDDMLKGDEYQYSLSNELSEAIQRLQVYGQQCIDIQE